MVEREMVPPRDGSAASQALDKPERTRSQTRTRVLDAAAKVFRQQGYGARLADIAEEAGLQAGSLYYHFDGREALVEEVLHLALELARDYVEHELSTVPADATAGERLSVALGAHAASVLEISDYSAAHSRIFSMASDEVQARNYVLQQQYGELFHALFLAAIESGEVRSDLDPDIVRMLLFGATNWTAEWYRPDRGRSAAEVIEQFIALVTDGLWLRGEGK